MSLKKKAKIDKGQKTLTSMFHERKGNQDECEKEQSNVDCADVIDTDHDDKEKPRKQRKFKKDWLTLYSWLEYDPEEKFMFCQLCTEGGKRNGLTKDAKCTNFQNSTLSRHTLQSEHVMAVQAPALSKDLRLCQAKLTSKLDKAATVVLKTVHWLAMENIPLAKFKSMTDFIQDLSVEDVKVLQQGNIHYDSPTTANDILESMSLYLEENLKEKMLNSSFVTALSDESTDISNHKRLVIYSQIIDNNMKPSTHFVANIECTDTTGVGIAKAIISEFGKRGISPEKIMSLGSDGASVMTGRINGAAAVIRRENPHCVNIHCIAHKLALCTSQAADNIPSLKAHQQILTDLFYYFKGSSKREARLHEVQKILDDPKLTYKELHSVRWLSYFEALTNVYLTLDSLLSYLSEIGTTSDPKAAGLKKKVGCEKFISICYLMMDAMGPVTVLSQFFQTENVDVALVKVKLELCVTDLLKVKALETPHLQQLKDDLKQGIFKEHHEIQRTPQFNLQKLAETFVEALITNIKSRFPSDDLVSSFGVLSMRPISLLSTEELEKYGNDELSVLCEHYGKEQTSQWKDGEGNVVKKSSSPIIIEEDTKKEWSLLKKVVVAEHYPRDNTSDLWSLVAKYHSEFPNLIILAKLCLTLAIHTAGCERGFSVQNQTLTPSRNRLNIEKQEMLMRVRLGPSRADFDFHAALKLWKLGKERRLYKLKSLK